MEDLKLIDGNEVCDLLGISRSTLYRWCDVSDSQEITRSELKNKRHNSSSTRISRLLAITNEISETPTDFPKPFKIGRTFKWSHSEIKNWIINQRVK